MGDVGLFASMKDKPNILKEKVRSAFSSIEEEESDMIKEKDSRNVQ